MKKFLFILLLYLYFICSFAQTTKVLFIGNSLTGWYDQPGMFAEFAEEAGFDVLSVSSLWFGSDLAEHLTRTTTLDNIASQEWDYVVLQGNKWEIAFPEYHESLYPTFMQFEEIIHAHHANTKIIFFMDWSYPNGVFFDGVTYSCNIFHEYLRSGTLLFADSLNFIVSPIGEAFNYVINNNTSINLIDTDNLHPSLQGSYLAACVYYYLIFGEERETHFSFTNTLDSEEANYLQDVAEEIVLSNYALWYPDHETSTTIFPVNNFLNDIDFDMYPIPVRDLLTIETNMKNPTYKIYNLVGELVQEGNITGNQAIIDLKLHHGIYLISILEEGKVKTKKFEVRK